MHQALSALYYKGMSEQDQRRHRIQWWSRCMDQEPSEDSNPIAGMDQKKR